MLRILPPATAAPASISSGRRCSQPAVHARSAHITLRSLCEALLDGLAAHRHYEELRSRGVAHDSALRQAFAVAPEPSTPTRDRAIAPEPSTPARDRIAPLCFAGRA
jgi:hypothetical protein